MLRDAGNCISQLHLFDAGHGVQGSASMGLCDGICVSKMKWKGERTDKDCFERPRAASQRRAPVLGGILGTRHRHCTGLQVVSRMEVTTVMVQTRMGMSCLSPRRIRSC